MNTCCHLYSVATVIRFIVVDHKKSYDNAVYVLVCFRSDPCLISKGGRGELRFCITAYHRKRDDNVAQALVCIYQDSLSLMGPHFTWHGGG